VILVRDIQLKGCVTSESEIQVMGSDGFDMLLRGHLCLSYAHVKLPEDDGEALFKKGVMQWAWEHFNRAGAFEPSFKVLAESLLQLALLQLKDPRKVWRLFSPGRFGGDLRLSACDLSPFCVLYGAGCASRCGSCSSAASAHRAPSIGATPASGPST